MCVCFHFWLSMLKWFCSFHYFIWAVVFTFWVWIFKIPQHMFCNSKAFGPPSHFGRETSRLVTRRHLDQMIHTSGLVAWMETASVSGRVCLEPQGTSTRAEVTHSSAEGISRSRLRAAHSRKSETCWKYVGPLLHRSHSRYEREIPHLEDLRWSK